ncbi:MAG: sulfatase-like hydrolase/transferase, partial [Candidatus Aminicenantales bacterium]
MKKYIFFSLYFALFLIANFFSPLLLKAEAKVNKPKLNLLLITIDTLRPDRLSCYSPEHLQTPHIDSLAQHGILFRRAFAHVAMTLPSHTSIMLGTIPPYHGVHDNSHFIVSQEFLTLAEYLKSFGYATGAFVGAFPLDSRFGLTQGFDVYDDHYGSKSSQEFTYVERKAEVVIEKATQWLETQTSPWFLWIHCFDPHQRYDPPEPFKSKYRSHLYNGEVAYVDYALGKFFKFLEEQNLKKQTIIIFTADHGESLGEHGETTHGYFAYNSTLWVPLIISYPGAKAEKIEEDVCHIDIYPTVCELLGLKKPAFLQGLSLMPLIKGKKMPKREIYFESLYPYYSRGWAPIRGFIKGEEKFIDSPIPEFYDLAKDFEEKSNIVPTKNLSQLEARLKQILKKDSYADKIETKPKIDRETQERLRSLGYVSGVQAPTKKVFTPQDDLKTLLPYQNKLTKAMGAYHHGRLEEGIKLLKEIIANRKDFDQAYTYLATIYKDQRKLRLAVETLREGLQNNPTSYRIITTFGIFLTDVGQYDAAINILKRGLTLIDYDPEIWNYLGVAYWRKKDYQKALEAYQKALSLDSDYPIIFNNLGSLYLSLFLKTREPENYQKSIENFKRALELDPNYASAYNGLGAAYSQGGDVDGAIFCWEKAVELKPDFTFPLYNLGLA